MYPTTRVVMCVICLLSIHLIPRKKGSKRSKKTKMVKERTKQEPGMDANSMEPRQRAPKGHGAHNQVKSCPLCPYVDRNGHLKRHIQLQHPSSHEIQPTVTSDKPAMDTNPYSKKTDVKQSKNIDSEYWDDNAMRFTQPEVRWLTRYLISGRKA